MLRDRPELFRNSPERGTLQITVSERSRESLINLFRHIVSSLSPLFDRLAITLDNARELQSQRIISHEPNDLFMERRTMQNAPTKEAPVQSIIIGINN